MNLGLLCRAKAEDVFVRFSVQNPGIFAADWGLGQTNVLEKAGFGTRCALLESHQEQRRIPPVREYEYWLLPPARQSLETCSCV